MKKWSKGILCSLVAATVMIQLPVLTSGEELSKQKAERLFQMKESGSNFSTLDSLYENEPNNTFSEADYMNLADDITGDFQDKTTDYFQVEVLETETLYVSTYADQPINQAVKVYNNSKQTLTPTSIDIDGESFFATYDVTPGEYYVEMKDLNQQGTDSEYYLYVSSDSAEEDWTSVDRIEGKNRQETAVNISQYNWDTSNTVVLATDSNFPDALSGAPLATKLGSPILLTSSSTLPTVVKEEIVRLEAKKVVILGGTVAVSKTVEDQIKAMGVTIQRIAGVDRYDTSAKIALQVGATNTALIAYGQNFPDALSAAPYAAANGYPILLTQTNQIPAPIKNIVGNYSTKYVLGGTQVISDTVKNTLKATRISGKDRHETSVNIAKQFDLSTDYAFIATGMNFADALAGSVLAADYYAPILLVQPKDLSAPVRQYIDEKGTSMFTILGGTGAVGNEVEEELMNR